MKLSIIIPVYNSEKFLAGCFESVFQQNLLEAEYEIIVVNDGSTDGSENIILDFKSKNSNLVFINQVNKGVSTARNLGLDIAKGEFITFIDSDDEIERNSLKTIIEKLENDDLDIFYPKIDTYSKNGHRLGTVAFEGKCNEIKRGVLQERRTFPPTFYRKELLKNIRFNPEIALGEDTVFNTKAQAIAQRVCYADIAYYRYTSRENSLSKQGQSEKAFGGFLKAIREIHAYQQNDFKEIQGAKKYFDKVYIIFVTRIIELNIMPDWNKDNYEQLVIVLKDLHLIYILDLFATKYPYVNTYFLFFKGYQKYLKLKSKIYNLIHSA